MASNATYVDDGGIYNGVPAVDISLLVVSVGVCAFSIYSQFGVLSKTKGQRSFKYLISNTFVWINVLYVVAVVATILRMVLMVSIPSDSAIHPEIYTIVYNWAASLICAVNAIMPLKFIMMTFNPFTRLTGQEDLFTMICVTLAWVVLLVATVVTAAVMGSSSLPTLLSCWRWYFSVVAFVELGALLYFIVYCMRGLNINNFQIQGEIILHNITIFFKQQQYTPLAHHNCGVNTNNVTYNYDIGNDFYLFCSTTFVMRIGIVASLIVKQYTTVLPQEFLKIVHMSIVCITLV
jgi:hypothetical protein